MRIGYLGPLTIDGATAALGHHDRALLAALALRIGDVLNPGELAGAIWTAAPPASWRKNLQNGIVRVRRQVGPDLIETVPHGYRLTVEPDDVDGPRFEQLVRRGRELLTLHEDARALYFLDQALALWRGRPLVDIEDWQPGSIEAHRLEQLRLDAEELKLEAALATGQHREVLADAQSLAAAQPMRERRWQLLALAQYQSGQQGEALRTIRDVRRMLVDELGLDPSPAVVALEEAILRQAPELVVDAALSSPSDRCPYRGLTPYDVDDADGFFGRERDVEACLDRLGSAGVLAVVGPSGTGKSSLVRAGVAAALRRRGEQVVVLNPGRHPLARLDATAAARPRRTILVIDQAEEVFSLCDDDTERQAFLDRLAAHADVAQLVIALRADRIGDVSSHVGLARMIERGVHVLSAIPADDLRTVVEGPARQVGLIVEPGLTDLLVREVEGEPGALPLLSHALRETWLRREGRTLTVAGYQASGGIRGAVAQSAEEVYDRVPADRRPQLRDLMLRLVSSGAEGEPVRARVPRRLVVVDPGQESLIDMLVGSRLVTTDDGVVEIAHEALARAWPRLRQWLEDDVEGRRILHHLTATADAWDTLGRPDSELYRGLRLAQAVDWDSRPHPDLTRTERAFLDASVALTAAEERAVAERERQQEVLITRLRASLAGAKALATENIDESLSAAIEGVMLSATSVSRANLVAALARHPQLVGSVPYTGPPIDRLEVSPDGTQLAVYDALGRLLVYDRSRRRVQATYDPGSGPIARERGEALRYSPDGRLLAIGLPLLSAEVVRVVQSTTFERAVAPLPGLTPAQAPGRDQLLSLAYDASGSRLAATLARHQIIADPRPVWDAVAAEVLVWDLGNPEAPQLLRASRLPGRTRWIRDRHLVRLSPDGLRVYTSMPLTAHQVGTGEMLFRTEFAGYALDLSADGSTIAIDDDVSIHLVDPETGSVLRSLHGHTADIEALRFSPDGSLLASSSRDHTVVVWDVTTGEVRERIQLGEGQVGALAWDPDGETLYTAGTARAVRIWDLHGRHRYVRTRVAPGDFGVGWVLPAPGGAHAMHTTAQGNWFIEPTSGAVRPFGPRAELRGGCWTGRGDRFASGLDHSIQVWDPATGILLHDNADHPLPVQVEDLAYCPDGSLIAVCDALGTLVAVDAETLVPVGVPVSLACRTANVGMAADGRRALVVVGAPERSVSDSIEFDSPFSGWAMADLVTGEKLGRWTAPFDLWTAALSLDGGMVALGGMHGEIAIADAETGQLVAAPASAGNARMTLIAWSPGNRAVATDLEGGVSLWDGITGDLLGRVVIPERTAACATFHADDRTVGIMSWRDGFYTWDTSLEHAVAFARAIVGRQVPSER